jgi:oxepin-CoA hydrolase/3-oxo-5,6-dehydrosuberyl-CoA semialdehyde dehydrogenase
MIALESYACGEWRRGSGKPRILKNAATGEPIAEASSEGLDFGAMLRFARERGGPALRAMAFPERAAIL